MAAILTLSPINNLRVESIVKDNGIKMNMYFDYMLSQYNVRLNTTSRGPVVYYSDCPKANLTETDKREHPNLSDTIDHIFETCARERNIIEKFLGEEAVNLKMICDVVYIPELYGLCFITASYKIGMACLEAVYGKNKSNIVTYTIQDGHLKNISGDTLTRIASAYLMYDMDIAGRLGYSYYVKPVSINTLETSKVRKLAMPNTKRFGSSNAMNDLPHLMGRFTDFIPVGYKWVSYTPFIFKDEDILMRLSDQTILGCDWISVPNLTYNGRELKSSDKGDSVTYYTTRKRLLNFLGASVQYFNPHFIMRVLYGIAVNGSMNVNADRVAYKVVNDKYDLPSTLTEVEYMALTDDERVEYTLSDISEIENGDMFKFVMAQILMNRFAPTMFDEPADSVTNLIRDKISKMSFESIYFDVSEAEARSSEVFDYVS